MYVKYTISFSDYSLFDTLIYLLEISEKEEYFKLISNIEVYDYASPIADYLRGYYYNFLSFRAYKDDIKFKFFEDLINNEKGMKFVKLI